MTALDTNRSNRRDLLKAAGAAGIVWTAPLVKPVTALAAGTCTAVQYDQFPTAAWVTPTSTDADYTTPVGLSCTACLPGGQVFASNCVCASGWASGVPRTTNTNSSFSAPTNAVAGTYVAPSGCLIVDATMLLYDSTSGSGCSGTFPCRTIGFGVTINPGNTTLTLPATGSLQFLRLRVLLCCS